MLERPWNRILYLGTHAARNGGTTAQCGCVLYCWEQIMSMKCDFCPLSIGLQELLEPLDRVAWPIFPTANTASP
jgi:hypothetical protein